MKRGEKVKNRIKNFTNAVLSLFLVMVTAFGSINMTYIRDENSKDGTSNCGIQSDFYQEIEEEEE